MGFDKEIFYLPNFIELSHFKPEYGCDDEKFILYCGRVSVEKGILTLIEAVKNIHGITLKIAGDGPIREDMQQKVINEGIKNILFLGHLNKNELDKLIKASIFTVITSQCYENNPRTVIESLALGKPVVGSKIGGIPELVIDGKTGFTFEAGNHIDLKEKIEMLLKDPSKIIEMGKEGRKFVEEHNNADVHYRGLMDIYQGAINKLKR